MIVTFYSYKGGVGRSMALANVASLLARRGLRVLMIDFDLEAPGLEQFFPINQPGIRRNPGLLDLLLAYKQTMSLAADEDDAEPPFMRLEETFLQPVYKSLDAGKLDLLHAGQREGEEQLASYAYNLRSFDWQDFYFNWAGEAFFEWLRQELVPKLYDIVLVDSRTGVTEVGGICAYQLADAIVMFCAANHQNVEGTFNVVGNFFSPAVRARRRNRPLQVLVVPSRIEQRDGHLLADFRERFESRFAQYVPPSLQQAEQGFWDLLIPYEASYAFEERVVEQRPAVEKPSGDGPPPITAAFERLAQVIARLAGPETALGKAAAEPGAAPAAKAEPLRDLTRSFAGYDAYLSYNSADKETVEGIARRLQDAGLRLFLDRSEIVPGESWLKRMEEALFQSRAVVVFLGAAGMGPWQRDEISLSLLRSSKDAELKVIPVLLPGSEPPVSFLDLYSRVDCRQGIDEAAISQLLAAIRGVAPTPAKSTVVTGNPYRGLEPFREQDAPFYFGREPVAQDLIEKLQGGARLIGVSGASGSGKTSLIQGGLFPALRGGALPGSDLWSLVTLRCGDDPPEKLTASLAPERDTLLFIDHFEKLFSVYGPEERGSFLDHLLAGLEEKDNPLRVVIAVREDFLGACLAEPGLAKALESRLIMVRPLTRDEMREAIEKPAQRAGIAFEVGLVERIIADLGEVPGAMPLLQVLLSQLWQRQQRGFLTASAYDEVGGVRGVIAYRAEAVYKSLDAAEQEIARRLLLRLVHTGEGAGDASRRATLPELRALHGDPSDVDRVLGSLVEAGLVIVGSSGNQASAELAHEILLRSWPRLQQWAEQDRQFLLWRERLRADVVDWRLSGNEPSYLLRGASLETAEEFLRDRALDLTTEERHFIAASRMLVRARKRLLSGSLALTAILVTIISFFTYWKFVATEQGGKAALSRQLAAQSSTELERGVHLALLLGVEALKANDTVEARSSLLAALDYGAIPRPVPLEHVGIVDSVTLNPDGTLLASGSDNGELILWDVAKHRLLSDLPSPTSKEIHSLAFSPDGKRLAVGIRNDLLLWNVTEVLERRTFRDLGSHQKQIKSLAFSPDGRLLVSSADDGQVLLWDVAAGRLLRKIGSHAGEVDSVAFSPDGRIVASGSEDKTIRLWSIDGGEPLVTFTGHTARVDALAFSPNGRLLASGSGDQTIILWDVVLRRIVRRLNGHKGGIKSLAFTPDGAVLVSGGEDQSIRLWSVASGLQISRTLNGHTGSVESISLNRAGTVLASGGADRQVLLWDLAPRPFLGRRVQAARDEIVSSVAFSPDGKLLATGIESSVLGAENPGLLVWDLATFKGKPFAGHEKPVVFSVAVNPKTGDLASSSVDGSLALWNLTTGQRRELSNLHGDAVRALAFSPDGRQLASGGLDREVVVLDLEPGKRRPLRKHFAEVNALAFSPDGRQLASGSRDTTVLLWDLATGQPRLLVNGESSVSSLSFNPDGKMLAVGSETGTALVGVTSADPRPVLNGTPVASVAFSPDGKMLASGGRNGVALLDVATRQLLYPLSGHAGPVRSVAFSPNGTLLATAGEDGSFILWDTSPRAWIKRACQVVKRNLGPQEWQKYLVDEPYRATCPPP